MSRIVLTAAVTGVAWGGKTENFKKGDVVEATAALATAIGAANYRTITTAANTASQNRDGLGESWAASNSTQ